MGGGGEREREWGAMKDEGSDGGKDTGRKGEREEGKRRGRLVVKSKKTKH